MYNKFYNDFDMECLDSGQQERNPKERTPFEQDRDRVIHSPAFRRLQSKTQVFLSGEFDFYRTRLTHSMEVAQIGRSICNHLNRTSELLSRDFHIDQDLVEAVCLAHDIGHPSYGHAGETVLNEIMAGEFGGFEGNAQNLRILLDLFYREGAVWKGMRPSRAFLDGMLKYKVTYDGSEEKKNHFVYDMHAYALDFVSGEKPFSEICCGEAELNSFKSLECQIMDWADDIAYSIHDISDGIQARFLTVKSIRNWMQTYPELVGEHEKLMDDLCDRLMDDAHGKLLGGLIGRFINATELRERSCSLTTATNRYAFEIHVPEHTRSLCKLLKRLSANLIFQSPQVHQVEFKGGRVLRRLFKVFRDECIEKAPGKGLRLLPPHYMKAIENADQIGRMRIVCDYLSGMTDGFVIRTYKRLFDPDFGSISDLI